MLRTIFRTILLIIATMCSFSSSAQHITKFTGWQDVSYLLRESAEFYGKTRGTSGTIALKSDGQKYWLYIHGIKFLPVNTVALKSDKAVLGIIDRGKPITFSLHVSPNERPYITFDTQRTQSLINPYEYGWEYYEPNVVDGQPMIQMYTGDSYTGQSSKPEAAKFYLVEKSSR